MAKTNHYNTKGEYYTTFIVFKKFNQVQNSLTMLPCFAYDSSGSYPSEHAESSCVHMFEFLNLKLYSF